MIQESINRVWLLSKKNISLYIKKGPVLIFGLLFPFFMTLSWVIGREISDNSIFIGIITMTSFFTATAISPVILPIETREKSLERILTSPISLNEILMGVIVASTLYSFIITVIISLLFVLLFSISFGSGGLIIVFLFGIGLMAILGSFLGLLVSAKPTDTTSDVMILINSIKFPLLFLGGIFIPLSQLSTSMVVVACISPITFLTDLIRYCVEGSNYFPLYIDILMLLFWIGLLFVLSNKFHKKTMPQRFSGAGLSKKQMMMQKKMMQ